MNEVKEKEVKMSEKVYSRRDMLKTAGKAAAGVAAVAVLPSFITGCDKKTPELPTKEVLEYEYLSASEDAPQYPFPYQKLDPATTMERAYASFFNKGGCCRAVIDGIIGQLGDNAGYPWNQIPIDAYANGAGGYGAASLCGSLAGAATAIGLAVTPEDAATVTADLFKWYTSTELPTYQPEVENETVVSASVNCKDSVGQFMEASGYAMGDPERKARCAGVAADCAGKTAELLNAYYNL
ncbi:C-GCAxxG-C-C family (seleno)protein [Proteiniclasticum sp. C24MP]|uniref:C-GCAxxG-C-C family (seleno)protein n=1 Tax=Proteiniclasticum sp. C24MP TaxID=3374101 RepID=UPI0037542D2D